MLYTLNINSALCQSYLNTNEKNIGWQIRIFVYRGKKGNIYSKINLLVLGKG